MGVGCVPVLARPARQGIVMARIVSRVLSMRTAVLTSLAPITRVCASLMSVVVCVLMCCLMRRIVAVVTLCVVLASFVLLGRVPR
jgi:hypothetical protein